jgi:hypothetical protein
VLTVTAKPRLSTPPSPTSPPRCRPSRSRTFPSHPPLDRPGDATPGTSQDNIRGFFYRGNVNIGGGTRDIERVHRGRRQQHVGRDGGTAPELRDGRDPEFKVSTSNYKAEDGPATGGLLTVVTKSGTNQMHGSGLLFFRDSSITAEEYPQKLLDAQQNVPEGTNEPDYHRYQYGGTIGGPIVHDKTHFFFAYEGTKEQQNFTINTNGIWPQYEGVFPSKQTRWTYNAKVDHQRRRARACSSALARRTNIARSSRPGTDDAERELDFGVPRQSAVLSHTGDDQPRAERLPLPVCVLKYQVAPPPATATGRPATSPSGSLCTPVFSYPSVIGRLRQRADGSRASLRVEGRLLAPDADVGGAPVEDRRRLQLHPVRGRPDELAVRQLDVPEGRRLQCE